MFSHLSKILIVGIMLAGSFLQLANAQTITPIADIQANPAEYDNVTIEGVVVVGAGVTNDQRLNVFVQDGSGKGIMIYNSSIENEHRTAFVRGNLVQVEGTVEDYSNNDCTTTEITNFTVTILETDQSEPSPPILSTGDADANFTDWDGTLIECQGTIDEIFAVGGGTNITIDDGSGSVVFRVWDSTNLNLSELNVGESITLRGIGSCYNGNAQYLPAYQDHINPSISGNQPPQIESVTYDPMIPDDGQSVDVTATITDDSQVVSATLYYDAGDGEVSVSMIQESGDQYEAEIPGFAAGTTVSFYIEAVDDSSASSQSSTYEYTVGGQSGITPIASIQADPGNFDIVTIEGIVTVGAEITNDSRLNAFVQDESGKGVMVYSYTIEEGHRTAFVRGNQVRVTGTVEDYFNNGCTTTEITDFTVEVLATEQEEPASQLLATGSANSTFEWDGTLIECQGTLEEIYEIGGGTNLTVNDGSGDVVFRVWDSTDLDLSELNEDEPIIIRGIGSCYSSNVQIVVAYQDYFEIPTNTPPSITNIILTPELPEANQEVTITATITDAEGTIDTTNITYSTGIDEGALAMNLIDTNTYQSDPIPGFEDGTVVSYIIYAFDDRGAVRFVDGQYTVGTALTSIADIQADPDTYDGQDVIIEGIVTVGAGITNDLRLNAFVQDESGKGVMIYDYDMSNEETLVRGNRVRISGTVTEYFNSNQNCSTTEITDFSVTVLETGLLESSPQILTSGDAAATFEWDGSLIEVSGEITDLFIDNNSNIGIDDGSGEATFRVWGSTGIDLSQLALGDTITLRGIGSCYGGAPQYLPAYQDHIITGSTTPGAPQITNITQEPQFPQDTDQVTITATIVDAGLRSVATAELIYTVDGEDVTITMTDIGNNQYQAVIPSFPNLTTVEYQIRAIDDDDNMVESSIRSYLVGYTPGGITPISLIQQHIDMFVGEEVTIEATVTMGFGALRNDRTDVYVQDESGYGLNVFDFDPMPQFKRGYKYQLTGEITLYEGKAELIDFTSVLLDSMATPIAGESLSIIETKSERWLWTMVTVSGTAVAVETDLGGGSNISLRDYSGSTTLRIWNTAISEGLFKGNAIEDVFKKDQFYHVTGLGSEYNDEYQIIVGYIDDVIHEESDDTEFEVETLAPGQSPGEGREDIPFAPDLGENLNVRLNLPAEDRFTLTIYDLEGRIVRELTPSGGNAAGGVYEIIWDGNNNYRERVNIGTYILFLEIRAQNGDVSTKMKPVVVGTPLR